MSIFVSIGKTMSPVKSSGNKKILPKSEKIQKK